ncbi:MAG: hypothetical protein J6Y02_03680 [Pseudobutyrivibrio sp.]|nr:hypothetical protein [Pseudobutyrivibrio sp.]
MSSSRELLLVAAKAIMEKELDPIKKLYYLSTLKSIDAHKKELDRLYNELIENLKLDTKDEETH